MSKTIRSQFSTLVGQHVTFASNGKALHLFKKGTAKPKVEWRLGMTGQFHRIPAPGKWKRHYFLELKFGSETVYYADPRRFGRLKLPEKTEFCLGGYSSKDGFWSARKPPLPSGFLNRPRIAWLLSNGEKTGIGNYMANEALGKLDLSPFEVCRNEREARMLLQECQEIARRSFKFNGNSFGSGYYRLDGSVGRFLNRCAFYQNSKIKRHTFQGRPVFSNFSPRSKKSAV